MRNVTIEPTQSHVMNANDAEQSQRRGLLRSAERALDYLCEFVFTSQCLACKSLTHCAEGSWRKLKLPLDSLLCRSCRKELSARVGAFCFRCGLPTERPFSESIEYCRFCERRAFEVDATIVLNYYGGLLRSYILRAKHSKDGRLAKTIARLLYEERRHILERLKIDLIAFVPMHRSRKRSRKGINIAETIAKTLARELKLPCVDKIGRIVDTPMQSSVDFEERRLNVRGAFAIGNWRPSDRERWEDLPKEEQKKELSRLCERYPNDWRKYWFQKWTPIVEDPSRPTFFENKRVLLVDDVVTSGATTNEIARLLREAGASSVAVAALARAGLRAKRSNANDRDGVDKGTRS